MWRNEPRAEARQNIDFNGESEGIGRMERGKEPGVFVVEFSSAMGDRTTIASWSHGYIRRRSHGIV